MSIPRLKSYLSIVATVLVLGQAVSAQAAELPDFTQLVEQASPAVVNISTTQKLPDRKVSNQQMPDLEGLPPMLREFFERGMPQQRSPRGGGGGQREAQSLGSGFIISPDGYILTNNHVIADADEILVRLADRSELKAKLIGTDPRSDVALLKIDGKDLPVLTLGESKDLKAGQWVVAIGSPFGFDHTVTQGIVSAVGRSLPNENYVPFIQRLHLRQDPGDPTGQGFPALGQGMGEITEVDGRERRQGLTHLLDQPLQALRRGGGKHQQPRATVGLLDQRLVGPHGRAILLQQDMRVAATRREGMDRRTPGRRPVRRRERVTGMCPGLQAALGPQRHFIGAHPGVEGIEPDRRHTHLVPQLAGDLDQLGNANRRLGMADIGLDRTG